MGEELRPVVAVDGEGGGHCGEGGEDGGEAPVGEEAGAVWGYLEAGADFLELFDGFEDGYLVVRVGELGGEGCC